MTKFLYKTALIDDQINSTNKLIDKADGVEVQLLSSEDDLSKLLDIELPVVSLHYPLSKDFDNDGCYCVDSNLGLIIQDDNKLGLFERVCTYAQLLRCSIGIHLDTPINSLDNKQLQKFAEIVKRYNVLIYLENITAHGKFDYISNREDLAEGVLFLRSLGVKCNMLVDTCHAKIAANARGLDVYQEIVDYIDWCDNDPISPNIYIHLSDAVGDGLDYNHGTNFLMNDDEEYLDIILNKLNNCKKEAIIVLEILDRDLINRPLARELHNFILEQKKIN